MTAGPTFAIACFKGVLTRSREWIWAAQRKMKLGRCVEHYQGVLPASG